MKPVAENTEWREDHYDHMITFYISGWQEWEPTTAGLILQGQN